MKRDPWVNDGFAVSLDSKEADFMANLTEAELKSKKIPMQAVVFAKKFAHKLATSKGSVSVGNGQEVSSAAGPEEEKLEDDS